MILAGAPAGPRDGAASTSTVSPACLAGAAPPPTRSDLVRGVRDNGRVMASWNLPAQGPRR